MKVIEVELRSPATLEGDVGAAKLVQGPPGESATVEIGTVTRGEEAAVTNVGSGTHAVLDFVLPRGDKGDTGEKGDQGDLGPRGATFTPSVDMETGLLSWTNDAAMPNPEPVDIRGPQGERGEKGETGAQGPKGDTGATGPQGEPGPQGEAGPQGETGPQGVAGERGPQGCTFTPSVDTSGNLSWTNDGGLANPDTVNIMGPQGPQGPQGAKGDTGAQGETGPQGPAGADGKSAYQAAVEAGYSGTEAELCAALASLGDINGVLDAINGEVV